MIEKITNAITPLKHVDKINEVIDKFNDFYKRQVGEILPIVASDNYVPEGCLPCDGAEYTKAQFSDLWDNFLTGELETIDENWSSAQQFGLSGTTSLAFGNGKFITGDSVGNIYVSEDGVNWSTTLLLENLQIIKVAFLNNQFVVLGYVGDASSYTSYIFTSKNGLNWTQKGTSKTSVWGQIAYANGIYILGDSNGAYAATSSDLITLTTTTLSISYVKGILAVNNYFYLYGDSKLYKFKTINDMLEITIPKKFNKIIYANDKFVAICGNNEITTSVDGINWNTPISIGTITWQDITFGDGKFIVVGSANNKDEYATSTDGINWIIKTTGNTVNGWNAVAYGNNKFVLISSGYSCFKHYEVILNTLLKVCSYLEYETDISAYGQCAKFAVDTNNETFRVPLIKNKETVVTNNVDYANKLALESTPVEATPFVAPYDGVLIFTIAQNLNAYRYCYINGVQVPFQYSDGEGITNADAYFIPLSKNDSLYWTSAITLKDGGFYPYKDETKEKLKSFVVVANGQTNQSLMDWSAWASSLQGKANNNLSNLSDAGKKVIDGQWVQNIVSLGTSTAKGTYTADLSSILPDDGYNYEVLLNLRAYSSSSSNVGSIYVYSDIFKMYGDDDFYAQGVVGGYSRQTANTFLLPVGIGRTISYDIVNYAISDLQLNLWGYRRIGTNQ